MWCSVQVLPPENIAFATFVERVVKGAENVHLTAPAGHGKSHSIVNHLVPALIKRYGKGGVLVLGSTGTSARVIQGVTLHSGLGVGRGLLSAEETVEKMTKSALKRIRAVKVILIDEGSMVSGPLWQLISDAAKLVRDREDDPMGGIRIIFCCDFSQLPPVGNPKLNNGASQSSGAAMFRRDDAQYAFQWKAWLELRMVSYRLMHNYRSGDDERLVAQLGKLRVGDPEGLYDFLVDLAENDIDPNAEDVTMLVAKNEVADAYNAVHVELLPGQSEMFLASDMIGDGTEGRAWLQNHDVPVGEPGHAGYADPLVQVVAEFGQIRSAFGSLTGVRNLTVKVGTKVLAATNGIDPNGKVTNGTHGIVRGFRRVSDDADLELRGKNLPYGAILLQYFPGRINCGDCMLCSSLFFSE